MEDRNQHEEMIFLLKRNNILLAENNEMLKKIRRSARIGFIFRILWIVAIIAGPLFLYWYFIEPFLATLPFAGQETGALSGYIEQLEEALGRFQQ